MFLSYIPQVIRKRTSSSETLDHLLDTMNSVVFLLTWAFVALRLSYAASISGPLSAVHRPSMRLIWSYDALANGSAIAINAFKSDMSAQLIKNEVCTTYLPYPQSYQIDQDTFATNSLTIAVSEGEGYSGEITLAGQTYDMSSDLACKRAFNTQSAYIDCTIPLPADIILKEFPVNIAGCASEGSDSSVHSLAASMFGSFDDTADDDDDDDEQADNGDLEYEPLVPESGLSRRQTPCHNHVKVDSYDNEKVTKWNRIRQVTNTVKCSKQIGCSVGHSEATGYTYGPTFSVTGVPYVSFSFAVSQSQTTTLTTTCPGRPTDLVCGYGVVGFIEYNAEEHDTIICPFYQHTRSKKYKIKAPLTHNTPDEMCKVNDCYHLGYMKNL